MIALTFNGAVNVDNIRIYREIFQEGQLNPNGCTTKGTFFVSHKHTNYSAVQVRISPSSFSRIITCHFKLFFNGEEILLQELHRKGHEIAVFSITRRDDPDYWSDGSYDDWLAEMAGARLIIERYVVNIWLKSNRLEIKNILQQRM